MKPADTFVEIRTHLQRSWNLLAVASSLLCLSFVASTCAAQTARLDFVSSIVPGYYVGPGFTELPVADFDGDEKSDLLTVATGVLQVVGVQGAAGWKVKQIIVPEVGPYAFFTIPIIGTWGAPDGAHLYYFRNNLVSTYSGWPLSLEHQFELPNIGFRDMMVADVDNDGSFELIVSANSPTQNIRAYSIKTGDLLWLGPLVPYYDAKLGSAQLDADPSLEITVSGTPGLIVDGATHAIEWQYNDGFGPFMRAGNFGGSTPRFAALGSYMTMFQSTPWSPLWHLDNIEAQSVAVADVDADGFDDIVFHSQGVSYGIRVINTQTQTSSTLLEDYYVGQIGAADFDGDSKVEVATTNSSQLGSVVNSLRVIDAIDGSVEFTLPNYATGPYVAGAFIEAAGSTDLVFASNKFTSSAGALTRVDASTGTVRWRSAAAGASIDLSEIRNVLVTHLAGQAHPVVLASGSASASSSSGAKIVAADADNGTSIWDISMPDNLNFYGLATVDLNADSITDSVLTCTSDQHLRLFDTSNQSQIWSSDAMEGSCKGSLTAPTDGRLQLIAVMSGTFGNGALIAYDAQTHQLSWSLPIANEFVGATYLKQGVTGTEFAIFGKNRIRFVDAETRSFLRQFNFNVLLSPLLAVSQPEGAGIHGLIATIKDKLYAIDGETGEMRGISGPLGDNAGQFNQLAVHANSDGSYLIGTGSDVAVFTHRLEFLSDMIFANGFESVAQ